MSKSNGPVKKTAQPSKAHKAARQRFKDTGTSIAHWARKHGFPVTLVYNVLAGRDTHRGKSHEIAVQLGIKRGSIEGQEQT